MFRLKPELVVVVALVLSGSASYVTARVTSFYRSQTDLALLKEQMRIHLLTERENNAAMREELRAIEKTLYGKPPGPRTPSIPEPWEIQRDADVKRRLEALERWRLSMIQRP